MEDPYSCENAIKRIWEKLGPGRELAKSPLSCHVFGIIRIKFPQIFHAIHEPGHPCRDVVITVEAKGTVCYSFGPKMGNY